MQTEIEQKSDLNHFLTNFLDDAGRIKKLRETPVLKAGPLSKTIYPYAGHVDGCCFSLLSIVDWLQEESNFLSDLCGASMLL
jgi:hypothetical protein